MFTSPDANNESQSVLSRRSQALSKLASDYLQMDSLWISLTRRTFALPTTCKMLISRKKASKLPPSHHCGRYSLNIAGLICEVLGLADPFWTILVPPCGHATCVTKPGGLLAFSTVDLVNILTPPLSSNFTRLWFVFIWSTAQLFGIPISFGTLNHLKRFAVRIYLKNWSCDRDYLYTQSGILALAVRRSCARLCHMFEIINDLTSFPESPLAGGPP